MLTLKIRDIMSKPVYSVPADATIIEAVNLMVDKKIGSVLVKNGNEYVGILTERDILARVVAAQKDYNTTKVSEVMSSPLLTVPASASLGQATDVMKINGVRRLVVKEKDKVVGIFSQRDLLNAIHDTFFVLASIYTQM